MQALEVREGYRSAHVTVCGFDGYPSCPGPPSRLDEFMSAPLPHQLIVVAYLIAVATLSVSAAAYIWTRP